MNFFAIFNVYIFGMVAAQSGPKIVSLKPQIAETFRNCSSYAVPPNFDFTWTCQRGPCSELFPLKRNTNGSSYYCSDSDRTKVCCPEFAAPKPIENGKGKPATETKPTVAPNSGGGEQNEVGNKIKKKPDQKNQQKTTTTTSTSAPTTITSQPTTSNVDPLIRELQAARFNKFDRDLLSKISKANHRKNIIVSPASVKSLLALLVEGSSGVTTQELLKVMQFQPADKQSSITLLRKAYSILKNNRSSIVIETGNKIFKANDVAINDNYEKTVKTHYGVEIQTLDFADREEASEILNNWVHNVTNGLIPTLVQADNIRADTKLFLANYVYLKARWDIEFDPSATQPRCFFETPDVCTRVKFMYQKRLVRYINSAEYKAEIFEIPFKDPRYNMVIMLPHDKTDVHTVLENLDRKDLFEMFKLLEEEMINLSLPRTTVEYSGHIVETLQEMGIKTIFGNDAKLDYLLKNNAHMFVCDMIHKAKIDINEEGAEAAAISGSETMVLSADMDRNVVVQRPFLFFIRDTTVAGFLFEGIVFSPDRA